MKLALVHDYLVQGIRGAERVVDVLHEMYPDAPMFTLMYDPDRMEDRLRDWDIRPSILQDIPGALSLYKKLYFLMPMAMDRLPLDEFDLVISSSCGWSKSAPQGADALHIAYCYSPARFLWFWADEYISSLKINSVAKAMVKATLPPIRRWDRRTAQRPQHMIAISETTYGRMQQAYQRDPDTIIYPPANTDKFVPGDDEPEDYFLIVSALNPYKRVDLAVEACNRLGLPLKVVGGGEEFDRLAEMAGPTGEMCGKVPDQEIVGYYQRCKAFIMPQVEDFGLTPLEANGCGRPVVAFRGGGATETMVEGVSCRFFDEQTVESLAAALEDFDETRFSPDRCRENALRFSIDRFKQQFGGYVEMRWQEHIDGQSA
ncbi:MAG: glycosyltransferase [Armatimonadia bacterium]|nr:glycosyltransferase [Armatimonadia bacterium]